MSKTSAAPQVLEPSVQTDRWMVVIFNNEFTAYEAVIAVLMMATQCSFEEAEIETWEAHHYGKASVHFGSHEECDTVARVIRSIGVVTEVQKEWAD